MKRLKISILVAAAALTLVACDNSPKCAAPLVAVDHGHSYTYYTSVKVGKSAILTPRTGWISDIRCEERR